MKDTTLSASLHLPNEALLFDLNALYACCKQSRITDTTWRALSIGKLAHGRGAGQMSGQDSFRGMAHWAKLRTKNYVRCSISNESVCRTIAPGAACWVMA